jgi:hypothetical protein
MLDPVAQLDQIYAEMRNLAAMAGTYRDDLENFGHFSPDEAFLLVRDWHQNYWNTLHGLSSDDPLDAPID